MTHQVTEETRKFVENAAGMGLPHEMIATLIGVKSDKTLRKKYRKQLDMGKAKANLQMATCCFQGGLKGNPALIIWWTKTQMGWKETSGVELSGPNGKPVGIAVAGEPELLGAYYDRLRRIAADRADPGADKNVGGDGQRGDGPEGGPDPGPS
jgi:hypothetical protein